MEVSGLRWDPLHFILTPLSYIHPLRMDEGLRVNAACSLQWGNHHSGVQGPLELYLTILEVCTQLLLAGIEPGLVRLTPGVPSQPSKRRI